MIEQASTGPAIGPALTRIADNLMQWAKVGVNHLQVRFPSRSVKELADQVSAFGTLVGPLLPG